MKSIRKRVLSVAIGLAMGWMAQGYWQAWQSPVMAQSTLAPSHAAADAPGGSSSGEADASHDEEALAAAGTARLIPIGEDFDWLGWALLGAAGLFGAAVVLGPLVSRFEDRQMIATYDAAVATGQPIVHHHKGSH